MYNIFEDEDDIFMGSVKSKFLDIVFNANRGLVESELERLVQRVATLELMLAQEDEDLLERQISQYQFENQDDVQTKSKSIFIESMGNILTQNE
jgi:hypothetical protein